MIVVAVTALPFISCKKGTGPKGETTITKINKSSEMGAVKMSHDKHEFADVKCIECHHKEGNDSRIKICGSKDCHTGEGAEDTIHDLCINCHKERKSGPTGCDGCHK